MSLKIHSKRRVTSHVMDVWSVYLQISADKRSEIQCVWHPYYTERIWRWRIRKHVKGIRWEAKDKITISAGLIFVLASRVDAFRNVEIPFKKKSFSSFFNFEIVVMEESPLKLHKVRWIKRNDIFQLIFTFNSFYFLLFF